MADLRESNRIEDAMNAESARRGDAYDAALLARAELTEGSMVRNTPPRQDHLSQDFLSDIDLMGMPLPAGGAQSHETYTHSAWGPVGYDPLAPRTAAATAAGGSAGTRVIDVRRPGMRPATPFRRTADSSSDTEEDEDKAFAITKPLQKRR